MGEMYEKGQTKKYSRVASFKNGGKKDMKRRSTKKSDEQLAMESSNREEFSRDVRNRFKNVPGSLKDAGKRILSAIAPVAEKAMGARDIGMEGMEGMGRLPMNPMVPGQMGRIPGMRRGGSVKKYSEGGESEEKKEAPKEDKAPKKKGGLFGGYGTRQEQLDAMGLRKGGKVKESKAMMKKEVTFMKKKGAPKSMIKHEEAEMKGKKTGVKKMFFGGNAKMGIPYTFGKTPVMRPSVYHNKKSMEYPSQVGPKPSRNDPDAYAKWSDKAQKYIDKYGVAKFDQASRSLPVGGRRPSTPPGILGRISPMARQALTNSKAKAYAAGGDLYTTPGGPARGKSGKIKKLAKGRAVKGYAGGGSIDGCAVKGKTRAKRIVQ